jgi:hypothetical protein
MKEILAQLRTLNDLDIRLQMIQRDLDRLPKEIAVREEELRGRREAVERRRNEAQRLRIEADALDLELKAGVEALKRLAGQMGLLRTPKEFETIKRQMDAQRVFNGQIEDKALALMTQADEKQNEADQLAAEAALLEAELTKEKARVEQEMSELRAQQDGLHAQRRKLTRDLPDRELAIYDRIVVNRGQAFAAVRPDGHCSACHMRLPPQVHNLALLARDLVTCPSCGRILTGEPTGKEAGLAEEA